MRGQLRHFSSIGFKVLAVSSDGPEIPAFKEEEQVPHHIIPLSRQITPLQDLRCIWSLYQFLRKERPDIVHSHTPKAGLIGMIAAFFARVPLRLHTIAGLPLMETRGVKRKVLIAVEKIIYSCATGIYPNSFALKAFIEKEYYSKPEKMKVIANGSSNGIDVDFFQRSESLEKEASAIREKAGVKTGEKVAVFVGRVTGDKGINELVSAMSELNGVKLFLIGPMEPELDPLDKATEEGIEKNPDIIWFGFQADVRPFLMAADFLVFPSYREGFPNVPLQAGALDLPCIVSDINGCNEIIQEEENGLIIPAKSKDALVEAMSRMIKDGKLFEAMKQKARPMVVDRYDRRVVWKALEKEYRQLAAENV